MRASAVEYRSLRLRGHELLRDVPLYDVSSVDLPGGGSGRTVADICALESATAPSHIGDSPLRPPMFSRPGYSVGIENRCGRKTHFRNACRNATDATPKYRQVLWMATFGSCINFREKRFMKQQDHPRLHLHCPGKQPERVPFVLGSLRPPCVVAHATVPRRDRPISLGSVSNHASPHSSRVVCCLHWHEPNRYRPVMDDSAASRMWLGIIIDCVSQKSAQGRI